MRHLFVRSVLAILALSAALIAGRTPARGDAIATLHSTGQGLGRGVVDPNFTITSATPGAVLNPGGAADTIAPVASPAYAPAAAGTQWIGPNLDNGVQQPTGTYDFRTTFSLAGLDPATAKITGIAAADNGVADIKLNGTSLGISGGDLGSTIPFAITTGFRPGQNTLDFIVKNDTTGGPTALMVSEAGTAAAAAPEPSTLVVFSLAALALCVRRARAW